MLSDGGDDQKKLLYGEITRLVKITVKGKAYEVPEELELLRCFQYLEFHISFENFCWNANCENCATMVSIDGKPAERVLCCQLPAKEGMVVDKLPEGVEMQDSKESQKT